MSVSLIVLITNVMAVAEGVKPKNTIWHLTSNSNSDIEQKQVVVNNNFIRGNKRKKRK